MKINKLNSIILLGLVAIIGILIAQFLWMREAFTLEEKKFTQKVHIALLETARKLYETTNQEFHTKNLIQKLSNDYYVVNLNDVIEPEVLEHFLKTEFARFNITTDFEYAIYNCESDDMVYGDYISYEDNSTPKKLTDFPKSENLVYYFVVHFPKERTYLFSSIQFWILLTAALIVILLVYVYSIYTILQYKKFSELQRDFINNMTHEFKTPLSSILLASNYLKENQNIKTDETLATYTNIITTQGKKLNHHVEKILNIARSDDAILKINPTKIHLLPFLKEISESAKLKNEHLIITLEIPEDLYILADEFHFSNVVYNLLDNSIKYCDEIPKIKIKYTVESKGMILNFIDNGIGISPKNIPYIFDKFYRDSNVKQNEVNGFGLGLFYVKKIVEQHHWKIFAENNSDKGITIRIFIPNKSRFSK